MNSEQQAQCEEVWKKYIALLRRMCYLKLRSMPDEIDDVISDVFLALCAKVDASGMPPNPKKWLYITLNNIILKKYRTVGAARARTVDIEDMEGLPTECGEIADIDDSAFAESVKKAFSEQLKEKEKVLFHYVFEENMKIKEIAALLQTGENAVRQSYYRLCLHMREIVEKMP